MFGGTPLTLSRRNKSCAFPSGIPSAYPIFSKCPPHTPEYRILEIKFTPISLYSTYEVNLPPQDLHSHLMGSPPLTQPLRKSFPLANSIFLTIQPALSRQLLHLLIRLRLRQYSRAAPTHGIRVECTHCCPAHCLRAEGVVAERAAAAWSAHR
jgi:hypothetical protein